MKSSAPDKMEMLKRLRLRWTGIALVSVVLLGGGYVYLYQRWHTTFAARWLLFSTLGALYLLSVLWRNLHLNRLQPHSTLLPDLGLANHLTYWRGMLVAATLGFVLSPRPTGEIIWVPGILYSFGILPDYLDGYIARITGHSTELGETLDVSVDSLSVLTGTILAIQYGQVPVWYVFVGFARYFFLAGLWYRQRRRLPVFELPPSFGRRALGGIQQGFTMVVLWPLFGPPETHLAAIVFALPFLINFGRDWLYVSGKLEPSAGRAALPPALKLWAPLILRIFLVYSLGSDLIEKIIAYRQQVQGFEALGVLYAGLLVLLVLGLQATVTLLLGTGIMARTMSILALGLTGLHLRFGGVLTAETVLVILAGSLVFYLGSGALSLWAPEDELLQRRAGESSAA